MLLIQDFNISRFHFLKSIYMSNKFAILNTHILSQCDNKGILSIDNERIKHAYPRIPGYTTEKHHTKHVSQNSTFLIESKEFGWSFHFLEIFGVPLSTGNVTTAQCDYLQFIKNSKISSLLQYTYISYRQKSKGFRHSDAFNANFSQ